MRKINRALTITKTFAFLLVSILFSCEANVEEDNISTEAFVCDPEISFNQDVNPIITDSCLECHSGTRFPDLRTFNGVNINASLIQEQVESRAMPQGSTLSNDQIELISCWIENGALDN